ncbi:MAG: glucosidase [Cyclobacteriaceae bacterium]
MKTNPELERLKEAKKNKTWRTWGPYLSERQWGTVREDYSPNSHSWYYFPHDMARSRAYRWGEDGIGGFSDNQQHICLALALWNGKDSILKERLFGLKNGEGNHGEDVKELYYYLDSSPTHSYMKMLYKYPHKAFPYKELVEKNRQAGKGDLEYEITDTKVFNDDAYFDVFIEFAKDSPNDLLLKYTVINRGKKKAELRLLPTIWFRNTWSWDNSKKSNKPVLSVADQNCILAQHHDTGDYHYYFEGEPELLFCENETNVNRFSEGKKVAGFFKDGINNYITKGKKEAVNEKLTGTKASLCYHQTLAAGEEMVVKIRFSKESLEQPFNNFDKIFKDRLEETNIYYENLQTSIKDEELKTIQRQAWAGLLWNKQFYYYHINTWLKGDPDMPKPSEARWHGRNNHWRHMYCENILSMPDKWEYPWFAAWDTAFQSAALARIDPDFAKRQLVILLREYYMHPNGQIPAYEWNFSDVNPPVHAWGAWRVYSIDKEINGGDGDKEFLSVIFHKLLMNFTWWLNIKDAEGKNLFEGGFLGLDNIGVFDRSSELPMGGKLKQADGTAWMAMYSLNMLRISLELSTVKPYYQEMASKFFEHFITIAGALSNISKEDIDLWDEEDAFYFDILHPTGSSSILLKVRSMVGLSPLFAVEVAPESFMRQFPKFMNRLERALRHRPDLAKLISRWHESGKGNSRMLSLVRIHRMKLMLEKMLDEKEFLSDYGIRALSKYHEENPYTFVTERETFVVKYIPGESDTEMFGGNSNWRGPVWFPVNMLLIESLYKFHEYYGDELKVEFPTGSGNELTLKEIAQEITERLIALFRVNKEGRRPANGGLDLLDKNPHFKDYITFYEYFHGDNGRGLGASHQTGWTALVAELIQMMHANGLK